MPPAPTTIVVPVVFDAPPALLAACAVLLFAADMFATVLLAAVVGPCPLVGPPLPALEVPPADASSAPDPSAPPSVSPQAGPTKNKPITAVTPSP